MSRSIELVVELQCEVPKVKWQIGRARAMYWGRGEDYETLYATLVEPRSLSGRMIELFEWGGSAPASLARTWVQTGSDVAGLELEIVVAQGEVIGTPLKMLTLDTVALVNEFLALKTSTRDLVRFLNKCGEWNMFTDVNSRRGEEPVRKFFLPQLFWMNRQLIAQDIVNNAAVGGDELQRFKFDLILRAEFPYLMCRDNCSFSGLKRAAQIQLLRGAKFRRCKRVDCGNFFEATNKRRLYCRSECAHLEVVRRGRKKQREKQVDR